MRFLLVALAFLIGTDAVAGDIKFDNISIRSSGFLKNQTAWFDISGLLDSQDKQISFAKSTIRLDEALLMDNWQAFLSADLQFTTLSGGFGELADVSGTLFSGSQRNRLWDPEPFGSADSELQINPDRAYLIAAIGPVDLKIGRQAISWGSALFWKPLDRFGTFSPLDLDPDVKRGVDAARAEIFFGDTSSLDILSVFEMGEDDLLVHAGGRLRTTLGHTDLALSFARFQYEDRSNLMGGLEFSGQVGDVGLRGEASINYSPESSETELFGVVGGDYRLSDGTFLASEFFYNGYGSADPDDYDSYFMPGSQKGERLRRGEVFNTGRYYLGISTRKQLHPLLTLSLSLISNLSDLSSIAGLNLNWSPAQNLAVKAGAMLPFGEKPEGFHLVSEFGAMPIVAFGVVKYSF